MLGCWRAAFGLWARRHGSSSSDGVGAVALDGMLDLSISLLVVWPTGVPQPRQWLGVFGIVMTTAARAANCARVAIWSRAAGWARARRVEAAAWEQRGRQGGEDCARGEGAIGVKGGKDWVTGVGLSAKGGELTWQHLLLPSGVSAGGRRDMSCAAWAANWLQVARAAGWAMVAGRARAVGRARARRDEAAAWKRRGRQGGEDCARGEGARGDEGRDCVFGDGFSAAGNEAARTPWQAMMSVATTTMKRLWLA